MSTDDKADRLRDWRKKRYLTQEELAVRIGKSTSTIQKLERGVSPGRPGTWRRIAKELRVDVEVFLGRDSQS